MNSLRRSWASCAVALRAYHRSVRRLRQSLETGAEPWRSRAQLERMLFELEVDVTVRRQSLGTERMTRVEEEVLYPALTRLESMLSSVDAAASPTSWRATLDAALLALRRSVRAIRDWKQLNVASGPRAPVPDGLPVATRS